MNALYTKTLKWLSCFIIIFPIFALSGYSLFASYPSLEEEGQVSKHDYLIGPGDELDIIVWRNPEVSMQVAVRPDGKITTPLVEDLAASEKTSTKFLSMMSN